MADPSNPPRGEGTKFMARSHTGGWGTGGACFDGFIGRLPAPLLFPVGGGALRSLPGQARLPDLWQLTGQGPVFTRPSWRPLGPGRLARVGERSGLAGGAVLEPSDGGHCGGEKGMGGGQAPSSDDDPLGPGASGVMGGGTGRGTWGSPTGGLLQGGLLQARPSGRLTEGLRGFAAGTRLADMNRACRAALLDEALCGGEACSVSFVTAGGDIVAKAHRAALEGSCQYFQRMFGSCMQEARTQQVTVRHGTSPETLSALLEWIYLGGCARACVVYARLVLLPGRDLPSASAGGPCQRCVSACCARAGVPESSV